jgi:hypothetical protein
VSSAPQAEDQSHVLTPQWRDATDSELGWAERVLGAPTSQIVHVAEIDPRTTGVWGLGFDPRLAILGARCGLSARDATDTEADTVITCPNCRRTLVPKLVIRGGVWRGSGPDPGIRYKCRWCDYEWLERTRQAS